MTIRVIDYFLSKSYANFLEEKIGSSNQQWFYQSDSTFQDLASNKISDETYPTFTFSFNICDFNVGLIESPSSNYLLPFIHQLFDDFDTPILLRCRLDMTVYDPDGHRHSPHTDLKVPNLTCIYYVNDSDGDTVIFNERQKSEEYTIAESITPKKNRLLVFDGDIYHTGHSPKKHRNRILINTNLAVDESHHHHH